MSIDPRYHRHMGLFGEEGQQRITGTRAVIVGLGGLGSYVAQQLAYLGVQTFVLIDDDRLEASNLNRLIGAGPSDLGEEKVTVVARAIEAIQPGAEITRRAIAITDGPGIDELPNGDVLFGCVDNDPARLTLLRTASCLARPYIDLATDVAETGEFGGRVFFAKDGDRCLSCSGELDQHALARAQMTAQQRAADDRIYGIDASALGATGPSVVSVNGVVASLAVTEFMVWRTGLREPIGHLNYRGDRGTVGRRADPPRGYCHYCMDLWGKASNAGQARRSHGA